LHGKAIFSIWRNEFWKTAQAAHNYEERGQKVLILKPGIDTKGKNFVVSQIGLSRKVDFVIGEKDSILEVLKHSFENIACICG